MTFPCIRICVERGRLTLYGAYFDVATGRLSVLDVTDGNFKTLKD
jgi:carbonic anhydrase